MAKVVLSGYYGFDNIGDEAILLSIIQALKEREPDIDITVLSHNPRRTGDLYGVKAVNRWRFKEVSAALKECDLLISGGGSLLQDVTGIKSLIYYLGVVWLAQRYGKPVFFYAQGIGPVNSWLGRRLMKLVVNRVQAVTVRDEQSLDDLRHMGVAQPAMTITADPVLGLKVTEEHIKSGREILKGLGLDLSKPILGVSVRHWPGSVKPLQTELARCCDYYVHKGWQVLFLPLHFPGDVEPSQRVIDLMYRKHFILQRNHTVGEFMGIIAACDMLVGMRLHSLIMAAIVGVPVVGLSYDPKIDRFLEQLDITPACHVNDQNCCVMGELQMIEEDLENERQRIKERADLLRDRALHTAELALKLLRNRS
ncbi:polysaccharide pyruvyl transferase CsaB [Desulfofalx alkaliphila]|uniref:polysaccharide pyruvyl transferase CsaB n=1 Tax=Desulfofalx alkaliphila TaxID=105483 RepID=UPI0004E20E94|nr:polysaccharide pyruvyl transferase CsaB [Desulfofalx alkaliphila]